MQETAKSIFDYRKQSVMYGFVFGLFSSVLLWLSYKYNLENSLTLSIISISVAVLLVFYPIHLFKLNNNNSLKLSQAMKIGLIIGLISGIIYGTYTYLHYNSIDTEFISNNLEESRKALKEQSANMSEEQLEEALSMTETMLTPFTLATFNLFNLLFKSFIISLVIGLIKKT